MGGRQGWSGEGRDMRESDREEELGMGDGGKGKRKWKGKGTGIHSMPQGSSD